MELNSLITLLILVVILLAVIGRVYFWHGIRVRRILNRPFPSVWLETVQRRLPFYSKLPEALQQELRNLIQVFIAEKSFVGCAGLQIDDEIRVTVAAQACLLLLNRKTNNYNELKTILIYPSAFSTTRHVRDDLGLVSTNHTIMLGESWSQGKVVLAWDSIEQSVKNLDDGQNVVLHEFAHQLDSESGATNGAPILASKSAYKSWAPTFSREFEELQHQAFKGERSLMDQYGATNPAEFFAVATETFFERPEQMKKHHEQLFMELVNFYNVNPEQWQ